MISVDTNVTHCRVRAAFVPNPLEGVSVRSKNLLYKAALMAASVLASVSYAQGQSVITGTVTDAATGKPVPDVVVTATSPALQGEEVVVTDASGTYRLPQLPAGTYLLKLEKESYKLFNRPDVAIRLDKTVRVNIQMLPESVGSSDVITVVGKPPTVDIGSTTTGVTVGKEFINNVPFIRPNASGIRSFESLAAVAPQVAADTYGFGFSGATSAENQIYLDGVSVNDPQVGTNGAQLPVDFIEEANVISGSYNAEYGRAGGGIITAQTKSGSNEFHGSVFANFTPGVLASAAPQIITRGASAVLQAQLWNIADFGAELGGPILKDRLWFYAGFSPTFSRRRDTRTLNTYRVDTDPVTGDESYGVDSTGNLATTEIAGYSRNRFDDRRSINYIAKLTLLINSDNNLSVSVIGSNNNRHAPYGGLGSEAFTNRLAGFSRAESSLTTVLKYSGGFFDKHLLFDASVGYFRQTNQPYGLPDDGSQIGGNTGSAGTSEIILRNSSSPISLTDLEDLPDNVKAACSAASGTTLPGCPATGSGITYTIGGFGYLQQNTMDRVQARASVTYLLSALGHHVFKGGIDYEYDRYNVLKAYSGGVAARQATNGASIADYRGYAFLSGPDEINRLLSVNVTPVTSQFGAYLQDSWSIFDRVTLNAGVRYDTQQLYDATGKLGMALNNMWSPRIGLIFDPTQQGRSKIYANFARYYQAMPLNIADRALSGENQAGFTRACGVDDLRNPDGSLNPNLISTTAKCQQYVFNGSTNNPSRYAAVTGGGRSPVDPNLQAQAKDEIVVGGEYEVISDLRIGVSYTKSWVLNIVEDMSNDEGSTYFIGNPGYGLATAFPKATRNYDAVTLLATKVMSDGWFAQLSYTWSYLRGNWAGFVRPETGQIDPGSNSTFDLKSLLANQDGPLPGDRTHFIKGFASKQFVIAGNLSLLIGLTYTASSGTPVSYLGSHPLYGPGEAYVMPRGAAGRTPWIHEVSVKGGIGYQINKDYGVQFSVDVLNFLNTANATTVDENLTQENVLPYTLAPGQTAQGALCIGGNAGPTCPSTPVVRSDDITTTLNTSQYSTNFKQPTAYQSPRQVRFGIKFTF
jgi:outer membrane receptor protein involved in Fe transport